MTRSIAVTLGFLLVTACGDTNLPVGPPLIVYASENDPANLLPLFAKFTADTGILIEPRWGDSRSNTDAVIAKQGTPADVLITSNVADIVRAADKGALRPISAESLGAVQSELKDPDGLWVSLERRVAVIAISPRGDALVSGDFHALGEPSYQRKLCLSSARNSVNQSLIAWLIEDLGLKSAERVVRGWVRNLASSPFASEEDLLAALASGTCEIGIVSMPASRTELKIIGPEPPYFDVTAMGVARHAQNAERAQQLIEWLILNKPLEGLADWSGKNVSIAGWRNEEALLLAERAGFR